MKQSNACNTCGCTLGTEGCDHQSLKNKRFAATLDDAGNVVAECCESCAQEIFEAAEESDQSP